ncbi:MAG: prepilin peptidase [Clostridia bacterium]|nr:prepilin peptidase [Clostridia bacterium]
MDLIDIIILVTIAISGTVFGSFFTLAVHRIPKKEDITHERSYCPKCNHKLNFLDLIPVFSYIFLGGKCRYCKAKIRPRYLILEICSGLVFLMLGLSYGINMNTTIIEFVSFALLILFLCAVFIIAGIDKEKYIIPNGVIIYGLFISIINVLVKAFVIGGSVYSNLAGFILIPIALLVINTVCKKCFKMDVEPFGAGDIKYLAIIGLFAGFGLQVMILELSLILILIYKVFEIIAKMDKKEIAWGFYLSIASAIFLALAPQFTDVISVFESMIML